jgi:hypothetical protein
MRPGKKIAGPIILVAVIAVLAVLAVKYHKEYKDTGIKPHRKHIPHSRIKIEISQRTRKKQKRKDRLKSG